MTSDHFVKVYGTILDSSIWAEESPTRILWITMLAMADSTGYIEAAVPGLQGRARITMAETEAALKVFESPDPHSKDQDDDGRRVEKAEGGWQLLNYQKYRDRRTESQIKRAERQQRYREKKRLEEEQGRLHVDGVDAGDRLKDGQRGEGRGERGEGSIGERVIGGKESNNIPTPSTSKNLPVKRDQHAVNKFIQSLSESSWARGRTRKEAWVAFGFFGWRNSIKQRVLFHKQREDRTIKLIEAYGLVRVLLAIEGQRTHSDFNDVHGKNFRGYDNLFRAAKGFENIEKCSAEAIEHGRFEWTLRQLAGLSKKRGWTPGPLDVELFNQIQGNAE